MKYFDKYGVPDAGVGREANGIYHVVVESLRSRLEGLEDLGELRAIAALFSGAVDNALAVVLLKEAMLRHKAEREAVRPVKPRKRLASDVIFVAERGDGVKEQHLFCSIACREAWTGPEMYSPNHMETGAGVTCKPGTICEQCGVSLYVAAAPVKNKDEEMSR